MAALDESDAKLVELESVLSPQAVEIFFDLDFMKEHSNDSLESSNADSFTREKAIHEADKAAALRRGHSIDVASCHPDANADNILDAYYSHVEERTFNHFGYPYNLKFRFEELTRFLKFSLNNLGDPYDESNYGVHSRVFELSVLDFFAKLWRLEQGTYWGYVTTCGTEGNLEAIYLAREKLPNAILLASRESHYSVFKAAKFYRMGAKAINTLVTGEIDYDHLDEVLQEYKHGEVIFSLNVGTTVKGAVDDVDRVLRIISKNGIPRSRYYIHCDGALFALMMPFVAFAPEVSFRKPIDSIAVSGHKFLGSPMPSGIFLTYKSNVKRVETQIEYLNSVDTTITGSRNGQAPLYLWYALRRKGLRGLWLDTQHCLAMSTLLKTSIEALGIPAMLNDMSTTVVFERPKDEKFIRKWQLACTGTIAHAVVMPSTTHDKVERFAADLKLVFSQQEHSCVKKHLGLKACKCSECKA